MQMMLLMVFFDFWVLPFLQLDLESSHCLHWPNNPLFEDHEQIISPGCTDWCDWRPLEGRVDDQQIVERIGLLGGTTIWKTTRGTPKLDWSFAGSWVIHVSIAAVSQYSLFMEWALRRWACCSVLHPGADVTKEMWLKSWLIEDLRRRRMCLFPSQWKLGTVLS